MKPYLPTPKTQVLKSGLTEEGFGGADLYEIKDMNEYLSKLTDESKDTLSRLRKFIAKCE